MILHIIIIDLIFIKLALSQTLIGVDCIFKEGDKINVRVIGQRFELNYKYISIIAELVKEKEITNFIKKPKIVIED